MLICACGACADSGGVCSLERTRGRRDVLNPFLVGGLMGAIGSVQRVDFHDGQTKHRGFSVNPRAMAGSAVSSALLCTLFWYVQQPSRRAREEAQEQNDAQKQQQQQAGGGSLTTPEPALVPGLGVVPSTGGSSEWMGDGQELESDAPLIPTTGLAQGLLLPELLTADATESNAPAAGADAEPAFAPEGALSDPWAKPKQ